MPVTRLHPEAEREATRLGTIRLIASSTREVPRDQAGCPASGPLISRTRRSHSRRALGGKTLALFSTTIQDASGRIVATRIDSATCLGDMATTSDIRQFESIGSQTLWPGRSAWIEESCRLHERMCTLRAHRASAIAALFAGTHGEYQPGLFDRRAEHDLSDQTEERGSALAAAEERVTRTEAAVHLSVSPPELRLLLFPRRPDSHP